MPTRKSTTHVEDDISHRELLERIREVEREVDDLNEVITKYRGFAGGILFVLAIFWGVVSFLKGVILKALAGN